MLRVHSRFEFLRVLRALLPERSVGVEVGVLLGDFSAQILEVVDPGRLFLVDPFEVCVDAGRLQGRYVGIPWEVNRAEDWPTAYSSEVEWVRVRERFGGDLRVVFCRGYSFDVVGEFAVGSLDFVYLDGCHLREAVWRDLCDWYPRVKRGGWLCGHDYVDVPWFGVVGAVDEFLAERGLELGVLSDFPLPDGGGDWAVRVP